jgi:hypothetical protein
MHDIKLVWWLVASILKPQEILQSVKKRRVQLVYPRDFMSKLYKMSRLIKYHELFSHTSVGISRALRRKA